MDRTAKIMTGLDKSMLGIEVAPWIAPIAPKAAGYNVRVMDVFDRPTLMARAVSDPDYGNRDMSPLEEVDYVGSATQIATIVPAAEHGTFDYIVSSHNFEHLPNPIKFLQGCAKILKPGGVLSMAVPDRRGCFDYYRPNSQLGDWLDAYAANRDRPTARQVFDLKSRTAFLQQANRELRGFPVGADSGQVRISSALVEVYNTWYVQPVPDRYHDTHCTVMTPASLELLLTEVRYLGLVDFRIEQVSAPNGHEFYVKLRFGNTDPALTADEFAKLRLKLCHQVLQDYVPQVLSTARRRRPRSNAVSRGFRSLSRWVRGKPTG